MGFYENVDRLLSEQHMSRRQLAIEAGIPESTLSTAFMRRSLRFQEVNKERIAAVLGVHWGELMDLEMPNSNRYHQVVLNDGTSAMLDTLSTADPWHVYSEEERQKNREIHIDLFDSLSIKSQFAATEILQIIKQLDIAKKKPKKNT